MPGVRGTMVTPIRSVLLRNFGSRDKAISKCQAEVFTPYGVNGAPGGVLSCRHEVTSPGQVQSKLHLTDNRLDRPRWEGESMGSTRKGLKVTERLRQREVE